MMTLWMKDYFIVASLIMIGLAIVSFFIRFEKKNRKVEAIVLIAVLAAIAAVSRIPFASLPSVQPTSFVIMMSALAFGSEVGFLVGCLAAIVSNMYLGQGPWTPWQMFSWGMLGFTAGLLRYRFFMSSLWVKNAFGFVWGFLYGWMTNVYFVFAFMGAPSWQAYVAACINSFAFDLAHGLSNVFFITIFSAQWMKMLQRVKRKYGLLTESDEK